MKTRLLLLAATFMISGILSAQQETTPPDSAGIILKAACKKAAAEKKNVMIVFHASWCGWCKKFEASVTDPSCKAYFDKNYIIKYLTILENGDKKKLENPGAQELFDNNGGKGGGIPYFLIFDKSGKLLADSKIRPANGAPNAKTANMGCPASDDEVKAFIEVLKKTSKVSKTEEAAISERFKKNK